MVVAEGLMQVVVVIVGGKLVISGYIDVDVVVEERIPAREIIPLMCFLCIGSRKVGRVHVLRWSSRL